MKKRYMMLALFTLLCPLLYMAPLSAYASIPAKSVLVIGDSNTEIGNVTTPLQNTFTSNYGDYGTGFWTLNAGKSIPPKPSGFAIVNDSNWSLYDMYGSSLLTPPYYAPNGMWITSGVANATTTVTFAYPDIDVYWLGSSGGGIFDIIIDSVTVQSVNTDDATLQTRLTSITGLSSGSHTMQLKVVSGTVTLIGVDAKSSSAGNRAIVHNWGNGSSSTLEFLNIDSGVFTTALQLLNPDLVIIMLGTNDHNRNRSAAEFQTNLESMISQIQSVVSSDIMLLSTIATNTPTATTLLPQYISTSYPQAADNKGVIFWDMSTWFGPYDISRMLDDYHFNATAGQSIAAELWSKIQFIYSTAGLTASVHSDTQVNLDWADNTGPGFSSYNVYRSTTGGFIPTSSNRIATGVTGSSYSSSGLSAATTYYYKVTAVDSSGTESAASNQASATTSATYNAHSQFSGTQGQNQWFYQYWDGSAYHDMTTYDSGSNRWDGPTAHGLFLRIFSSSQSPGLTADSVRKWVAPGAGTVTISGNVRKGNIGGGDGVNAKIIHGSTTIFDQDIAYDDNVGYDINLTRTVSAGDILYFRVHCKLTDSYDNTLWSQTVVFTPSTAYNAQNQFSDTQGQNQWSYQYWDGSVYRNMTYDSANARWNGPASYGDFLRVFAASQAPGTSADSVRKWVAPGAGTVMISGNVRKGNVGGGDGVNAKIVHGSTTIFNQDIAYDDNVGYNINLTRTVSAGDAIYFRVNMKSTEAYDNTIWSQTIVFTP